MKETLLRAERLVKTYAGAAEPVLDGIDVQIYRDDFTVIMGPSGAGKSTLLYCLGGMDNLTGGEVYYGAHALGTRSEKQMAALRAQAFGFVFQQTHLVSNLTLFENVAVAGYLDKSRTEAQTHTRAAALLEQMRVGDARDHLPSQSSGGERQRAAIARAVINEPTLLFADEPTGALNRKNSEEVLGLLTALHRQGQSILMVTHDLKAAIRGTRVLYLEDGKILDELPLPPYDSDTAKAREEQLSAWLAALSW